MLLIIELGITSKENARWSVSLLGVGVFPDGIISLNEPADHHKPTPDDGYTRHSPDHLRSVLVLRFSDLLRGYTHHDQVALTAGIQY